MARRDLTGAIDFAHLNTYMAGDVAIIEEVLALFVQQADLWERLLDPTVEGWRDAVHTIKGASRGIGAFALGDACEAAEQADRPDIGDVLGRLDLVRMDIAAWQHEQALRSLKQPGG